MILYGKNEFSKQLLNSDENTYNLLSFAEKYAILL